ncbi:unnamed protein product [Pleuronectes platessa]|uniref:Uncharacterized protein n=1 Tax=Pleuronectes platessa TaxID=8262 RepID=A0A9N7UV63_PLEPL|nr:unnamed protein product [Pleuronectes platessa]
MRMRSSSHYTITECRCRRRGSDYLICTMRTDQPLPSPTRQSVMHRFTLDTITTAMYLVQNAELLHAEVRPSQSAHLSPLAGAVVGVRAVGSSCFDVLVAKCVNILTTTDAYLPHLVEECR